MSARPWFVPLCIPILIFALPVIAQTAATQPAAKSSAASAAAATQPTSLGSVQEAMRHLATIPRPRTAREASPNRAGTQTNDKRLPYSKVLPGADPGPPPVVDSRGRQTRTAMTVATGLPTPEEIQRAFPNRVPAAIPEGATAPSAWQPFPYGQPGYGFNGGPGDFAGGVPAYDPGRREYFFNEFYDESQARTDSVLKNYSGHLAKALALFNRGQYVDAADAFRLASDMHQGDPAARLYTAHALFAIGRYRDAVPYIRRAFQLQPRVVFLGFDIRDDYGHKADFDEHRAALEAAQKQLPNNLDRLIMLGYVYYFSHERSRAYDVLREAYRFDRSDPLVLVLLDNSRPPDVMLESRTPQR